ncbi:4912_t:CDS:1 [Dentiscutata heterogama]|uniref:4912_t:CDS:1 n=1 Tax=Dentiscutata heterogama TaxID=1316150 RepID=A0ACA9N3T4_9GLOM|nr:4912_t:CDS:1 [Dentiscutata heterogama]
MHKELLYNVKNKTKDELVAMIQRFYLFKVSEDENDVSEDYKYVNNKELDDDLVISNHQIVVLINNIVDLYHRAFNQVEDLYVSNKDNINFDVTMNEDHKFNLKELDQDLE